MTFQKGHPFYGDLTKPNYFQKGQKLWLGKHHTEETKKKLSEINKGKPAWNKGKKLPQLSEDKNPAKRLEVKKKLSEWAKTRTGEKSPVWQGGKSFEIYPEKFWRIRKAIRERDDYTCQLCGKYPVFEVHHIDYNKENNEPENLITLCKSCHMKTNFNREYWISYFKRK